MIARDGVGERKESEKTVMELVTDMQKFWAGCRMVIMSRQQGVSWADTGAMSIVDFFHVLQISERNAPPTPGKN